MQILGKGDQALYGKDPKPISTTSVHVRERSNILDVNPAGWDENYFGGLITNTPFNPILYAYWNINYLYIMVRVDRFSGINLKLVFISSMNGRITRYKRISMSWNSAGARRSL